jgi:hypothetical protein
MARAIRQRRGYRMESVEPESAASRCGRGPASRIRSWGAVPTASWRALSTAMVASHGGTDYSAIDRCSYRF